MGRPRSYTNSEGRNCSKCKIFKSWDAFYLAKEQRSGHAPCCKSCWSLLGKEKRSRDPEKYRIISKKSWWKNHDANRKRDRERQHTQGFKKKLRQRYGISIEQYEKMAEKQKGLCFICENLPRKGYRLSVDHDHITGQVRGLLCNECNIGIGYLRHDIQSLQRAINYLKVFTYE